MVKKTITLTYLSGPKKGQNLTFKEGDEITIGRYKSSTIVFDGPENKAVSRKHATIECLLDCIDATSVVPEYFLIKDHSTNGTRVNGKRIENGPLKDGDVLSFSKGSEHLRVSISSIEQQDNQVKHSFDDTTPSFTKFMPASNTGFLKKEVISQSFFIPAVCTILVALLLFIAPYEIYKFVLGFYLGIIMIIFIKTISNLKVPFWLLISFTLSTSIIYFFGIPFFLLSLIFRPPFIWEFIDSSYFITRFIGNFVGAGIQEELFKAIPVFLFIAFRNSFSFKNIQGLNNGKVSPTLTTLIGACSAVGFMLVETLGQYVREAEYYYGEVAGLMLLIPRFISGIAGHIGFSGIFSYYIGLAFYYKKFDIKIILIGLVLSSTLHGLWNATASVSILIAGIIAISTFIIFISYLVKARKSFPV